MLNRKVYLWLNTCPTSAVFSTIESVIKSIVHALGVFLCCRGALFLAAGARNGGSSEELDGEGKGNRGEGCMAVFLCCLHCKF